MGDPPSCPHSEKVATCSYQPQQPLLCPSLIAFCCPSSKLAGNSTFPIDQHNRVKTIWSKAPSRFSLEGCIWRECFWGNMEIKLLPKLLVEREGGRYL